MSYRKRTNLHRPLQNTFSLNITSMTDMFTILLVFLLQTYASSDFVVDLEPGVNLPISSATKNPTKSLKISLSKEKLRIEDQTLLELSNSHFLSRDLAKNDLNLIEPLFKELLSKKEKLTKEEAEQEQNVLLQADSSLDYSILHKVMYTASQAGFSKIKLATVAGN